MVAFSISFSTSSTCVRSASIERYTNFLNFSERLTFEIVSSFFHVRHLSFQDNLQVLVGLAFEWNAVPDSRYNRWQLKFFLEVIVSWWLWLVTCNYRWQRANGWGRCDGCRWRRLFGWAYREQTMQVGNKIFAVYFPLFPDVEYPRDLFLDFVFTHQCRRFLKRRSPTVHKFIISPFAMLNDVVGEIEERQATFDFNCKTPGKEHIAQQHPTGSWRRTHPIWDNTTNSAQFVCELSFCLNTILRAQ